MSKLPSRHNSPGSIYGGQTCLCMYLTNKIKKQDISLSVTNLSSRRNNSRSMNFKVCQVLSNRQKVFYEPVNPIGVVVAFVGHFSADDRSR